MATPFKSLSKSWKQIIIRIPAAIRKFPHINVFGKTINSAATMVTMPFIANVVLLKPHFPNISIICGLPINIAEPCFRPINTATRMSIELMILPYIVLDFKMNNGQPNRYPTSRPLLFYLVVYPPFAKMVCPVIHQPSVTRNSTKGAISLISVSPPKSEACL